MENVSLVMAGAQLGITVCSLGLGAVGEPAVAHLLEPVFARRRRARRVAPPGAVRGRLASWSTSTSCSARWCRRTSRWPVPSGPRCVLGPPMMLVVTAAAAGDRGAQRHRQRRAAAAQGRARGRDGLDVHPRRGRRAGRGVARRGLLEDDEYDRLAGALGFTERTVASVLLPVDGLTTVPRGATVADVEEVCAETGYPGSRSSTTTVSSSATSTSRTSSRPTSPAQTAPSTTSGSGRSPRSRPATVLHDALDSLQRRGAHMARVVDDDGACSGS